ncbi:enoyl-CoA hydratase/isomerase family protein [Nesterenkonia marinintestina]|uniref:enoyl-CoA hydratase/isomerase family protein n=1 Tax=Nesterenkonia marinintestina TaxID=2979865 RepID=UPI0021BF9902|nr:enoyl-CoA hydratase/isomerase family protein [Nesterenkonia sp. GX14115]
MGRETYTGDVAFEVRGHLGIITLNRPKALNALTKLMCESVLIQLQDWADDDDVAQVLVRGAGDRGLCAGGDVVGIYREITSHSDDGGELFPDGTPGYRTDYDSEEFWRTEYRMNQLIARYPKPYVALMDGVVLGGGIGISAHGSHRIVTERTKAGMPETTIGFTPDVGGAHLLSGAPLGTGLHAGMTGAHLGAADVLHLGLADAHMESVQLESLIDELTRRPVDEVLPEMRTEAGESALAAAQWIPEAYSADTVEEILSRLDATAEAHPEAGEAAATLRTKSPTSLKVTLRSLRAAQGQSLEEVLRTDYTLGVNLMRSRDFREGIRAQLVDKDRDPRWTPATLQEVDEDLVERLFTPAPGKTLTFDEE